MSRKRSTILFSAVMVLALATMACRVSFDLPLKDVKTGPTETESINIPTPSGDSVELTLGFGAGEMTLAPGAESALVEGTAIYNVRDLKPEITSDGGRVSIETGDLEIRGLPNFTNDLKNVWDFKLGSAPMRLEIDAGAYSGQYEFGGLALRSLRVTDGAAKVELSFSKPNLVEMSTLRYDTGASTVALHGLANANFAEMVFKAGAGSYTLDFTGEFKRDATVTVDAGMSSVVLVVPAGTDARVFFDGGLSNVDISGDWEKSGDGAYVMNGTGPTLTVNVNMGAGSLELRNR